MVGVSGSLPTHLTMPTVAAATSTVTNTPAATHFSGEVGGGAVSWLTDG